MLLWGAGQPFSGALADRFGAPKVLACGAALYVAGLIWMAYAQTAFELYMSAGVLIGLGLAGCSFSIVIGAFAKLMPPSWRTIAFGAGTAAGSFGQFLFSPLAVALIGGIGWQATLLVFAVIMLITVPLAFAMSAPPQTQSPTVTAPARQTLSQALAEALGHKSYVLLSLGYFTCGFQLHHCASGWSTQSLGLSWTIAITNMGSLRFGPHNPANLMPSPVMIYFNGLHPAAAEPTLARCSAPPSADLGLDPRHVRTG